MNLKRENGMKKKRVEFKNFLFNVNRFFFFLFLFLFHVNSFMNDKGVEFDKTNICAKCVRERERERERERF